MLGKKKKPQLDQIFAAGQTKWTTQEVQALKQSCKSHIFVSQEQWCQLSLCMTTNYWLECIKFLGMVSARCENLIHTHAPLRTQTQTNHTTNRYKKTAACQTAMPVHTFRRREKKREIERIVGREKEVH